MKHVTSPTVAQICEAIGRDAIARSVDVKPNSVSNAIADNRFPARWFIAVKELCDAAGMPCPAHLFHFAGVSEGAA